jgi:mRNA interferase RelE/StbE
VSAPARRQALFLKAARDDLGRLASDDPALAKLALLKIRDLEAGRVEGVPLESMAKSGDLDDCRKLYFGPGKPPSHRIVYRPLDDEPDTIEIVEIIAIEARSEMYAYLLAAVRLGRLPTETKPEFNRVHQRIIKARAQRRSRT